MHIKISYLLSSCWIFPQYSDQPSCLKCKRLSLCSKTLPVCGESTAVDTWFRAASVRVYVCACVYVWTCMRRICSRQHLVSGIHTNDRKCQVFQKILKFQVVHAAVYNGDNQFPGVMNMQNTIHTTASSTITCMSILSLKCQKVYCLHMTLYCFCIAAKNLPHCWSQNVC